MSRVAVTAGSACATAHEERRPRAGHAGSYESVQRAGKIRSHLPGAVSRTAEPPGVRCLPAQPLALKGRSIFTRGAQLSASSGVDSLVVRFVKPVGHSLRNHVPPGCPRPTCAPGPRFTSRHMGRWCRGVPFAGLVNQSITNSARLSRACLAHASLAGITSQYRRVEVAATLCRVTLEQRLWHQGRAVPDTVGHVRLPAGSAGRKVAVSCLNGAPGGSDKAASHLVVDVVAMLDPHGRE
jgi:hypothetical protein